jgi:RNA polymerase sigma-70 factor (ECF subfamily)
VVDEGQLVAGLRAGAPDAFDRVYDRYRAPIFGFLLRLTRDRPLAEDLLQETWLRVARGARALAPDSRLKPWLFRIAYNLFVSHRRWSALNLARLGTLRALGPGEVDHHTPEEAHAANDLQRRLESALGALKAEHREVLLLVAVEGMEPQEAAEVLTVSAPALRQRLKRARDALAHALTEEEREAVGRT